MMLRREQVHRRKAFQRRLARLQLDEDCISGIITENIIVDLSGVIRAVISSNTLPFHGRQQLDLFVDDSRSIL